MAADMQKPNGLTCILIPELPQRLYSLQLQDIPGIGRKMDERLKQKNIHTVEQLLNLSEQQMHSVWGSLVGSRYFYLLKGKHIDVTRQHTKSIGHEHVIPPKERTLPGAMTVVHKLISKAAVRLRRAKMMSKSLNITIRYMDGYRFEETFHFHATQDTSLFLKLFNEAYKKAPLKGKPFKASITLANFTAEQEHQLSMFENEKRNVLFKAVDAINNRYGKSTVYVASLHEQQEAAPTRIAFSRIPEIDEL
jgi:DNA polymerase-4